MEWMPIVTGGTGAVWAPAGYRAPCLAPPAPPPPASILEEPLHDPVSHRSAREDPSPRDRSADLRDWRRRRLHRAQLPRVAPHAFPWDAGALVAAPVRRGRHRGPVRRGDRRPVRPAQGDD